ncbi:hypothetical protein [Leptospira sp. GIMC2001]|uniref:hypothetical protein n=1 Tax=Leptospira sp. GIMC2001 TaxID=1513297 RepID=UPI00234964F4|nr:hypothetical protein [Leptospira sp. GIMC2001]WCL48493.1 hypothetical protein O4O04_14440 [Leptospira sp. GIMC2001]
MKQKFNITALIYLSIFLVSIGIFAQKGAEQRPSGGDDDYMQKPYGGFDMSITGTWNCGDLGTMKITQSGAKFSGTYSSNGGKVKGIVNGNSATGTWREKDGSSGEMEWKISIERKTPKPTHLRGHWKNSDSDDWEDEWICTK